MLPINFPEKNKVYEKPEGWIDEECGDLNVWQGDIAQEGERPHPVIISCWKPSFEDLQALNAGQPLYLMIHCYGMPPVQLFTENPFVTQEQTTDHGA